MDLSLPHDAAHVRALTDIVPKAAVVLGSGLSDALGDIADAVEVSFAELPGCPRVPGVQGQAGRLVLGTVDGLPLAVFEGRVHLYQGVSALDAAYTARLAAALGADTIVLTNAAGGLAEWLSPGELVLLSDHINLTGQNPLVGWPGPKGGNPFVPMGEAYDPELRRGAIESAGELGVVLREGVYAWVLGPSYETPAETGMLRRLGADVVGMSTVPEVILARALGMRVAALSLVTNVAGGAHISHEEVLEAGRRAKQALSALLPAILRQSR